MIYFQNLNLSWNNSPLRRSENISEANLSSSFPSECEVPYFKSISQSFIWPSQTHSKASEGRLPTLPEKSISPKLTVQAGTFDATDLLCPNKYRISCSRYHRPRYNYLVLGWFPCELQSLAQKFVGRTIGCTSKNLRQSLSFPLRQGFGGQVDGARPPNFLQNLI
jgi:hypothetical protein